MKKKNELEKFLIDLEALSEIHYGMVDYFQRIIDDGDELEVKMVIQAFRFVWENSRELMNKYYPMLLELTKKSGS